MDRVLNFCLNKSNSQNFTQKLKQLYSEYIVNSEDNLVNPYVTIKFWQVLLIVMILFYQGIFTLMF